jgi:hypothetical protein
MNIRRILLCSLLSWNIFFIQNVSAFDATFYNDAFEWWKTANGSIFSQSTHTAAICNEELGSLAYIRSWQTGAVVTLNDRPNCSIHTDIVDLSKSAFELFSPLSRWRISEVSVSPIGENTNRIIKKNFDTGVFSSLWVYFTTALSNTYFAGDSILIEGKVLDKKEYVMIYFESENSKKEYSTLVRVEKNGKFKFPFTLPKIPGRYYFVVASGNSFQTSSPEFMNIVSPAELTYPEILTWSLVFRPVLIDSKTPYVSLPSLTWWTLTVNQGEKKYKTSWTVLIAPTSGFQPGWAEISINWFSTSTPSSLDRSLDYGRLWTWSVILDRTRDIVGKNKVNIRVKKGSFVFQFRVGLWDRIRNVYYVTFPNGDVREYKFQKEWVDDENILIPGSNILGSFMAREPGVYKIETVLENGYAYFNLPVYQWVVWSVLSSFSEKEKVLVEKDFMVNEYVLNRINMLRGNLQRNSLELSADLSKIAQLKAENMANNNYVWHWTPEWLDILEFAKSLNITHPNTLSENVAGWNVSYQVLQDGLEESWSHRHSMVYPQWKKIGIGYSIKNKKGYLVQVFSQ